jgi:hypothetical protein
MTGGPTQTDTFDMKPGHANGGQFKEIATSVPGIHISELMPRVASRMDKFAIIRSLVGAQGRHDSFECCTGHHFGGNQPQGGWPAMGSSLSKLLGPVDPSLDYVIGVEDAIDIHCHAHEGQQDALGVAKLASKLSSWVLIFTRARNFPVSVASPPVTGRSCSPVPRVGCGRRRPTTTGAGGRSIARAGPRRSWER